MANAILNFHFDYLHTSLRFAEILHFLMPISNTHEGKLPIYINLLDSKSQSLADFGYKRTNQRKTYMMCPHVLFEISKVSHFKVTICRIASLSSAYEQYSTRRFPHFMFSISAKMWKFPFPPKFGRSGAGAKVQYPISHLASQHSGHRW